VFGSPQGRAKGSVRVAVDTRYVWRVRVQDTLALIAPGTNQLGRPYTHGNWSVLGVSKNIKPLRDTGVISLGRLRASQQLRESIQPQASQKNSSEQNPWRSVEVVHRSSAKCS
jgi:hypothetical protein